ncbi:MAG: CRISPR-associated endoribonuclease Cas6, partial [Pyrinomonadaceae bacterium]|nr:CRISPR-associated endoribonuclease Cas6 [Pyrinomonadaceae bacterium]
MRLHFTLSPNEQPVPFAYQHHLVGAFHKWIGRDNELHDRVSLYSLSWLDNGRLARNGFEFPHGAHWFISLHDESLVGHIVNRALAQPEVCFGMRVTRIEQQATPHFDGYHTFKVGSPVLARGKEVAGKVKHLLYSDPEADEVLTTT